MFGFNCIRMYIKRSMIRYKKGCICSSVLFLVAQRLDFLRLYDTKSNSFFLNCVLSQMLNIYELKACGEYGKQGEVQLIAILRISV